MSERGSGGIEQKRRSREMKKKSATLANRRIRLRFLGACCLNVFILGLLGAGLLGGSVFFFVARPNVPWLFSGDGLSLVAYLGAALAAVVRYLHECIPFLPDADTYAKAAEMKFDVGVKRRARHKRMLAFTGPVPILVASGVVEAVSLFLKAQGG